MKLYKITNEQELHHGLQYKTGLNIDTVPFYPSGSCQPGGIYYTTAEYIFKFFGYGPWIRTITLPEDAKTYKDPEGDKWKADKVILGERRKLNSPEVFEELKEYILKSPELSYRYAEKIADKKIIKLLEKTIATNANYSYEYARDILKGRFELGEKKISTDTHYSYRYALHVLKGRFELGEPIIATDACYALSYSTYVLNARFELGEKAIATDEYASYYYARDVLKGRFELGEKEIAEDAEYSRLYEDFLKSKQT